MRSRLRPDHGLRSKLGLRPGRILTAETHEFRKAFGAGFMTPAVRHFPSKRKPGRTFECILALS